MQITWMEFKDKWNVDVNFIRETGTQIYGVIEYFQIGSRPAWVFRQDFYAEGDLLKDIQYVCTLPELKEIEKVLNDALKHPDGPNAYTMKLYYEDTL
jgi:hypothetical protein